MSDTEDRDQTGQSKTDDAERQRRQEELNGKLLDAAKAGNNEDVIQFISDGAEITSRDGNGDTGLRHCAFYGHKDVMDTFLKHKLMDVNIKGQADWTPLMHAARCGHLFCVQLLLAHGADTELKSLSGETALIIAAMYDYPDIIGDLLRHGADDQVQNNRGWNAITIAKMTANDDAFRMLTVWKEKNNIDQEIIFECF